MIREPENLTKHGNNAKFFVRPLSSDQMRSLGFTDYTTDRWYRCWDLGRNISFSVSISKSELDWCIDVLDEMFGQPYDYQYMIMKYGDHPACPYSVPEQIRDKVDDLMSWLTDVGILDNWERGDYI